MTGILTNNEYQYGTFNSHTRQSVAIESTNKTMFIKKIEMNKGSFSLNDSIKTFL
jgi:hypothetical protein